MIGRERLLLGERECLASYAMYVRAVVPARIIREAIAGCELSGAKFTAVHLALGKAVVAHLVETRAGDILERATLAHERGCLLTRCAAILDCTVTEARYYFRRTNDKMARKRRQTEEETDE